MQKPRITHRDPGFGTFVRGGGIEPPWLLTASTSSEDRPSKDAISRGCERQETSESGCERRILPVHSQNPSLGDQAITGALRGACETWQREQDRAELRLVLYSLLAELARPLEP
jgi:hypothetical protein